MGEGSTVGSGPGNDNPLIPRYVPTNTAAQEESGFIRDVRVMSPGGSCRQEEKAIKATTSRFHG